MPTYAYACTSCDHRFDVQQSFTDEALTQCPSCEGRLRKLFSSVGVVFKGSGFYRTDSRAGETRPGSSKDGSGSGSKGDGGSKDGASSGSKEGTSTSPKAESGSSSGTPATSSGSSGTSAPAGGSTPKAASTTA